MKKYIDDVSGCEKLHSGLEYSSRVTGSREETRYIHATQGQALFDTVRREAASKGMRLNPNKTSLLCISAARSYEPKTYINLSGGEGDGESVIISGKSMKLLGFHFNNNPSAEAHINAILKKVRYRTWYIHNLKRLGLSPAGLLVIYTSLIRPCFEYSSVVYHSLLTWLVGWLVVYFQSHKSYGYIIADYYTHISS